MTPRTITNGGGESLTFLGMREGRLQVRSVAKPGAGPPMHVHHRQDESMTVERGTVTYQYEGEEPRTAGPGETVTFRAGSVHRWWNAGEDDLECEGWIGPPDNFEYFLTALFSSLEATGGKRPRMYDAAFLLTRYRTEFGMTEIPQPVQRLVFPVVLAVGRLLGKHRRYADAPAPVA